MAKNEAASTEGGISGCAPLQATLRAVPFIVQPDEEEPAPFYEQRVLTGIADSPSPVVTSSQ